MVCILVWVSVEAEESLCGGDVGVGLGVGDSQDVGVCVQGYEGVGGCVWECVCVFIRVYVCVCVCVCV